MVARRLLLLFSLALVTCAIPTFAQTPIQKVVFTPWKKAPRTWTKYDNETLTSVGSRFQGTKVKREFRHLLLSKDFEYIFSAPAPGIYTIRIGSIEKTGCKPGKRGFQYTVNGVTSPAFNVAELVGCETPYTTDIAFTVGDDLTITLTFVKLRKKWAGSISNFQLFEGTPTTEETPAPTPSATPSPSPITTTLEEVELDVGPDVSIPDTTAVTHSGSINVRAGLNVPANVFQTARKGMQFERRFNLAAGTYDIELGFVEVSKCEEGARVFNVLVNGNSRLEAFDIFKEAGACRKAIVEKIFDHTVDPLQPEPVVISFHAVVDDAILSFIRIKPSGKQCVPVTSEATILADHLAHSVPGTYPPGGASSYVDRKSAGFVRVSIDGSGSHTHFSYSGGSGRIKNYRWTIPETGKVISNTASFERNFPLGTTRLKLTVTDNACSRDEAETTVSVTGNKQPGPYCYYYEGLSDLPAAGTLLDSPRPTFAAVSNSVNFGFPSFPFDNTRFVARCIFSVEFSEASENTIVSINTGGSGIARVYEGEDIIIDSETATESGPIITSVGLASFEVIYRYTDTTATPSLSFRINGTVPTKVIHDQSTVMPIITAISPSSGRIEGGARTKISGFGLYRPLTVHFGGQSTNVLTDGATAKQVFALPPAVTESSTVQVTVESSVGIVSNAVPYTYANDCDDVGFMNSEIKTSSGGDIALTQPTAIAAWSDGKLYIGTRVGRVQVVDYDADTMVSSSLCQSEVLTDSRYKDADGNLSDRAILGITFDPRDTIARPYVSVSTLFWQRHKKIDKDNERAWSNGAVERLKPASAATRASNPNQCLEYDRNIVRNLPVADGDHSVNELVFDQNGDLLIAIGGFTNAGLPYGGLGGNWETYFSGSIARARLSRGAAFDGDIPYTTPENLRTAKPEAGYTDVDLYATGVRNLFSMAMARTGKIYALDMGPNCRFGNASSSCSEYNEAEAALRSTSKFVPFPGQAITGPEGECKYGDGRADKILEIKSGKFYGHSNIQRSVHTGNDECQWIDPKTGRVPPPFNSAPPANYEHRLAMVKSAKTGVREYGANLFCGKLRGDLLLSQINSRGVWRAKLLANGKVDGNPFMFHANGGIRIEENAHGDLLFPKYFDNPSPGVYVMRPKVSVKTGVFVSNAVPFRHGRGGGTKIVIGGWGFTGDVSVKIGGGTCAVVTSSDSEISCTVPSGAAGSVADVTVSVGGVDSVLPNGVLYMAV